MAPLAGLGGRLWSGAPKRARAWDVVGGWETVTSAEMAVVDLVAKGLTSDQVARRLCLSINTVNSHLRHVFMKLGGQSRVQLTRLLLTSA
jgi:DNA-binding CsgD family transcriptional regulator